MTIYGRYVITVMKLLLPLMSNALNSFPSQVSSNVMNDTCGVMKQGHYRIAFDRQAVGISPEVQQRRKRLVKKCWRKIVVFPNVNAGELSNRKNARQRMGERGNKRMNCISWSHLSARIFYVNEFHRPSFRFTLFQFPDNCSLFP